MKSLTDREIDEIETREQLVVLRPEKSLREIMDDPSGEGEDWFYVSEESFLVNAFKDIPLLISNLKKCRRALRFYADKGSYKRKYELRGDEGQHTRVYVPIEDDKGQIACEALGEKYDD